MPYKDREAQLQAQKQHYINNKDAYAYKQKKRRKDLREYIQSKKDLPCTDCGIKYPSYVMDFDHRDPTSKHCKVSSACERGLSVAKIQAEIDKCDLVCANCHRIRTHG